MAVEDKERATMPLTLAQPQQLVIDKALADTAFRRRLLADPVAALRDVGLVAPDGVTIAVVEDTATLLHLVLPPAPDEGVLSDSDLDGVAGGSGRRKRPPSPWDLLMATQ